AAIGAGQIKVGLLLPLSGSGNAGAAGVSMRSAAELALSEFNNPNIQLLVKDDGGSAQGAQAAAQQALDEGAEVILGPLFAVSVGAAGQVARARGVPVIAFSTDTSVAAKGVYLLSFLPESDVDRVVDYSIGTGLWDDPRIFSDPALQGGWFAAPDTAGFRNFSGRYRARFGQEPVRTATLAYDAVSLVAALVKTQGGQRFSEEVLTNPSGFS